MIDTYTGVYRVLACPIPAGKERIGRRGFAPHEVDMMDITTVGVLIGAGSDPLEQEFGQEMAELARRRRSGEDVSWEDVGRRR